MKGANEIVIDHADRAAVKRAATVARRWIARLEAISSGRRRWIFDDVVYRAHRSTAANAYHWSVIVPLFLAYLREQGNDHLTAEDAHEILKQRFIEPDFIIDRATGEAMQYRRGSSDMDSSEFSEFEEKCIAFLQTDLGIPVPAPERDPDKHIKQREQVSTGR
jgi:hypothetical protein